MDSKLPQLDPKLKEAYDRVLNGQNVQSSQNPTSTTQQKPINTATAQPSPVFEVQRPQTQNQPEPAGLQSVASPQVNVPNPVETPAQPPQPQPVIASSEIHTPIQPIQAPPAPRPIMATAQPQSIQTLPPVQNIGGSIAYNAAGTTTTQTVVKKGKPNIMHFLLGLGAVVFLIAYTFMWIFIFKIKLPFLPA